MYCIYSYIDNLIIANKARNLYAQKSAFWCAGRVFAFLFFVFLFVSTTSAQTNEAEFVQRFDERFIYLDSLIFHPAADSVDSTAQVSPYSYDSFLRTQCDTCLTAQDSAYMELVRLQGKAYRSKTGLSLTGQAYYRFDNTIGFDEDDAAAATYDGKLQAELRWYFLQSALFKRKGYMEEIRLKSQIAQSSKQKDEFGISIYRKREYFRYLHDSLLSGILQHRLENLRLLNDAKRLLLSRESIGSDELLQIIDQKAEAERIIAAMPAEFPASANLSDMYAFLVRVDTAALLSHIHESQNDMELLDLRIQLLRQQERNTSYWSHFNLAPFVRYSYYIRAHVPNTSNFDAGVSFTIPITGEYCYQRKALRVEQEILQNEKEQVGVQVIDRIRYMNGEIERLNRTIAGEVARINELRGYLAERAQAYRNRIGDYNLMARVKEYNMYLFCMEKLIDLQYQRNSRLMDLQEMLIDRSILQYCTAEPID